MSNVHVLACCTPVYKDHPSRVRKYHSMRCRISPGAEILATVVRRAEVASHAETERAHSWNRCSVPDCETCAYIEAHLDDEDDRRRG